MRLWNEAKEVNEVKEVKEPHLLRPRFIGQLRSFAALRMTVGGGRVNSTNSTNFEKIVYD